MLFARFRIFVLAACKTLAMAKIVVDDRVECGTHSHLYSPKRTHCCIGTTVCLVRRLLSSVQLATRRSLKELSGLLLDFCHGLARRRTIHGS